MKKTIIKVISCTVAIVLTLSSMNVISPSKIKNYPAITANATYTYGDWRYNIHEYEDGEFVSIYSYDGKDDDVIVPNKINGLPVLAIVGGFAHANYSLKSIKIPDDVLLIGDQAFSWCTHLQSIKMPEHLEYLGKECFENCYELKEIYIPEGITEIKDRTFISCRSLKELSIPSTVTSIGNEAFNNCIALESIDLPDSIATIKKNTFDGCESLRSLKLPDNITDIDYFGTCKSLKELTLPYYLEKYSSGMIGCPSLERLNINAKLKSIQNGLNGKSLKEINVDPKNNYFSSDDGVLFNYDKSLIIRYPASKEGLEFNVPDSVTEIGEGAFSYNSYLRTVYLSENTTAIEPKAFQGCSHLDEIYVYNKDCEIYMSSDTINSTAVIYGYKDSTAQEYAENYGLAFKEIKEELTSSTTEIIISIKGDANCDDMLNMADAVFIMQAISNPDKYQLSEQGAMNADTDESGDITNKDALRIQQYKLRLISSL